MCPNRGFGLVTYGHKTYHRIIDLPEGDRGKACAAEAERLKHRGFTGKHPPGNIECVATMAERQRWGSMHSFVGVRREPLACKACSRSCGWLVHGVRVEGGEVERVESGGWEEETGEGS